MKHRYLLLQFQIFAYHEFYFRCNKGWKKKFVTKTFCNAHLFVNLWCFSLGWDDGFEKKKFFNFMACSKFFFDLITRFTSHLIRRPKSQINRGTYFNDYFFFISFSGYGIVTVGLSRPNLSAAIAGRLNYNYISVIVHKKRVRSCHQEYY